MKYLTRNDEIILLAILRLKDLASLLNLRDNLNQKSRKKWSIGNLFVSLEKLEEFGLITSQVGKPTQKQGGKGIKFFMVSKLGIKALREIKTVQEEIWDGLTELVFNKPG